MAFVDELKTIRDNMTAALKTLSVNENRGPQAGDKIDWPTYRDHLLKSIMEMDERIRELELLNAPVEVRTLGIA